MAYTTIKKPSDYFNTVLYTGDGTTNRSITGVNFQPDWVWIKNRSSVSDHVLFDIIRGVQVALNSNDTSADDTISNSLTAFNTDGFSVSGNASTNASSANYVGWNWLASNTTASNTDGSISSTVSANTTSGFSIVSYTGTGSPGTVGHGLGTTPSMIIVKDRTTAGEYWHVYHKSLGATKAVYLNTNDAAGTTAGSWNSTEPTSTVFSIGTLLDTSSANLIAYCFAEKQGFSKFGSYTGNGSADGPMIYTGFKPAMVIFKNASIINHWFMYDNKRDSYNQMDKRLYPSQSNAEATDVSYYLDFLSNGFKIRTTSGSWNGSGNTIIYMAFAEEPLVGDNPATAR